MDTQEQYEEALEKSKKAVSRMKPLKERYSEEVIADAVYRNFGALSIACIDLDCSVEELEEYLDGSEKAKRALDHGKEHLIDLAERAIGSAVRRGDTKVAQFVLKTIGASRGWREDTKINVFNVNPDEQLKRVRQIFGMEEPPPLIDVTPESEKH